jgi:hypothetical protein
LGFWHPSKVLYTFLEQSPFAGAFSQKTVKFFWGHMKDAGILRKILDMRLNILESKFLN